MIWTYVIAFIVALTVSLLFGPAFIRLAIKKGVVDHPGPRRVNVRIMPRLGGPTIVLGFFVATAIVAGKIDGWLGIITGALIVFTIGVIDDVRSLRAGIKLVGQVIAAVIAYYGGVRIEFISNPFGGLFYLPVVLSFLVTVFWIVAVTNAVNLMDGLDGLAAGIVCIAALTFFLVAVDKGQVSSALLAISLVGSTAGFLRWNFYPAKTFMGDSGAYFLGYTAAVIAVVGAFKSTTFVTLLIPVLALGLPIFDTSFAIVRRYQAGQPIMTAADRGHLHHRFLAMGFHHRKAVIICYALTLLLSSIALALIRAWYLSLLLVALVLGLTILLIITGKVYKRRPAGGPHSKPGGSSQ